MIRRLADMTPLLGKEGKVLIYNTPSFSSFLRRSTLTEASGGGGWLFKQSQFQKSIVSWVLKRLNDFLWYGVMPCLSRASLWYDVG